MDRQQHERAMREMHTQTLRTSTRRSAGACRRAEAVAAT